MKKTIDKQIVKLSREYPKTEKNQQLLRKYLNKDKCNGKS